MDAFCRIFLGLVLLALPMALHAETSEGAIRPALAPNPAVLAKLAALQPNQAMLLGNAKVVGDFNAVARRFELDKTGPLGRDYSIKMVWAPERKRALFTGANHGRPHRLNDVWEFDLASLTWVMLYAPDNPRSYGGLGEDPSDVRFEDGILITHRGGPVEIGHSWWGITYDAFSRRLLFMNVWDTNKHAAVRQLGGEPEDIYGGPGLWSFDPQRQKWQMLKTLPPYPRVPMGGLLEFISELGGGAIWHTNHWQMLATWIYRLDSNQWQNLHANAATGDFAEASPQTEQVGYYDPVRKIVVVQRFHDTFVFDIANRQWQKVHSRPENVQSWPHGHDAFAPMYLDPESGHGLLVDFRTNEFWSYDPDENRWSNLFVAVDNIPKGSKRLAYYDVENKVFVILDGTAVWVYRYSPDTTNSQGR